MSGRAWAVVAGGGTAGHVLPALAAARALVERGHDPERIHFVGSERGLEARLVPEAGLPVTLLPGRGIARRLTLDNVGAAAGIARGTAGAVRLLRLLQPSVVLSVGGYASVPCAVAAAVLRIPLVLHEQNAVPGLANRLAGRVARASAVSFPETRLPRAVVTGNPVRPEVLAVDRTPAGRDRARRSLGLPEGRLVVAVFGGSLGARRVNHAAFGLVEAWSDRTDVAVRHAVGARDWEAERAAGRLPAPPAGGIVYQPVEYEAAMPALLAAADLVVCRAGGTTVAELAAVGVPAVLVPLPGAPDDHQTANAGALVRAGAAVLVPDGELTPARLAAEVGALLDDPERLRAMGEAGRRTARPDAADRVAALVERHARE